MKDNVIEIVLYDNKYDTKHNTKMVFLDNDEVILKIYEKTSIIKRLRYIGENTENEPNIRYKQIPQQ